jgi:hypothetical protein
MTAKSGGGYFNYVRLLYESIFFLEKIGLAVERNWTGNR